MPGKKLGTIDVEFQVKDKLPLHGSLEYNNRSTHDTTDSRINAMLRYDNLWQKEHSWSLQYQISPEQADEVGLFTSSYTFPTVWNDNHLIALYGLYSDSDTATADDIQVMGQGYTFGMRYMANLAALEQYLHHVIWGVDYKDFEDSVEGRQLHVAYVPLYLGYTGIVPDKNGQFQFTVSINMALRDLTGSDAGDFSRKRYGARGNYFYGTLALERLQKLGKGWHLNVEAGGQLASQPLLSNEQYVAGGASTVRGYHESEAAGDSALFGSLEISAPDIGAATGSGAHLELTPYIFYDAALLRTDQPLPGEGRPCRPSGCWHRYPGVSFQAFRIPA